MRPAVESAVRRQRSCRLLPEQSSPAARRLRSLSRLLSCIRFDEVLVLQGSPLLGAVFSIGRLTGERVVDLAIFAAGSFCLLAHVFALNDWSGMGADSRDPNRTTSVFLTKGIGHTGIRYLWMALLVLSLLLLSPFGSRTLIIALAIAGLSALYSAPAFHMKGVPLLNSALHLIGGLLHFLLGYSLFRPVDGRSLEIGCFFALAFAAGHLTHEARDRDADLLNGIWTNAVTFGKAGSFAAGIGLFTIADVLLVVLAARGTVPRALVLVAALYTVHLYWSLRTLRAGLNFESIRRLQVRYRALYAIIGLMMVVTVLV
jgi:4-hydroxybenzoate polyprenyltransferase